MLNLRKLTMSITMMLLTACATAPDVSDKRVITKGSESPSRQQTYTAEELIAQARQAEQSEQPGLLLSAVKALYQQGDCKTTLKVLQPLIPAISDIVQKEQARLIFSQCLLAIDQPALAKASLDKVSNKLHILPARLRFSAELAEYHHDYLTAANYLAELISLNPSLAESHYPKIWQLLEQLDTTELTEASATSGYLTPWLELARLTRQTPSLELSQGISLWQQQYPTLPIPEPVQQLFEQARYQPQNIAVILPLSGRLGNQGQAIKEGVLAAYFAEKGQQTYAPQLRFYDSVLLNESDIQNLVLQHDFVLGPLLRENIPGVLTQLPPSTPALLLNRVEQEKSVAHHYFYSLAPEDEARQLARYLHGRGYKMPMLISAGRPLFERMAEQFVRQWQELERQEPTLVTFTDNKSMRNAVDSILAIDQSERRIQRVRSVINQEVYSFARNRRDVDAIIVFSNPAQTELLNPMIESSISPFSDIVPVFATSRSFSKELGNNSLRDLRNLVFVDMPWMLPGADSDVKAEINELWPNRSDSESRLFAMGYDAYRLIPELTVLHALRGRQIKGLTGELSMDKQNRIVRRLPFGKIELDRVVSLAGD
ncbi:penicillin-binding protein activator [Lacimicrobium alkaliphilum]|uniref:Penicillin-binding protein activator n=1 Tax=Lacimicrobium alkaliphilum TaxID=1526571 RepID=A0ABQ1QYG2_9ALTE|nr:penicillin-binding protein activator [Lacimicrobium alkaliphilum]GGD51064.1 penicillin-binding protein activator [Lacimicrobium alkaliphilum]